MKNARAESRIVDRAQVDLEEEAVLARDAMAFAHLRCFHCELRDPRQLAWGGLDPDDRGQLIAEGAGINLGAVACDHAGPLEALDALGHSWRRQVDAPAQLGERDAAIARQLADDPTVGRVDLPKIVGVQSQNPVLSCLMPP